MTEQITYSEMVKRLFKPMEGVGSQMMHACIGMAGESAELRTADSRENMVEEFGDIEFYLEAAWQQLDPKYRDASPSIVVSLELGNIQDEIHKFTGEALDFAKKVWAHGGSKGNRDEHLAMTFRTLERILMFAYSMYGLHREAVRNANMDKLLTGANARYASGSYSDQEALARADKTEPRKFFSDVPK